VWNARSAPYEAAMATRAPCLVVLLKWFMSVFDVVFVCVYFEVGVHVGCGFAYGLRDECVRLGPCVY
jgi:hypothetical protein